MGYEIEVHGNLCANSVFGDIKYHCGELVQGYECQSFVEAGKKVNQWVKNNPFMPHHGCKEEYCIDAQKEWEKVHGKLETQQQRLDYFIELKGE